MSEKSVYRYLSSFHSTGSVEPKDHTGGPGKCLSDVEQLTILQCLVHKPTLFLDEVQEQLYKSTGKWVHASTICCTIKQNGFTHKKVQVIALQQSEAARLQYMAEISVFNPDMLVWIHETGSYRRNSIRSYGYSLQGMAARTHVLRVSGKRVSAIPVLTTRGIEDTFKTSSTVDGEKFEEFICQCVLPILLPFDGLNPRSVVIMDNASIHHLERVHDIVTGVGARLVFLPPYSPDLMPLEEVFSKVKSILRANDSVYIASSTPEIMVKLAFCAVTQDDCIQYIKHGGYM